MLIIIFQLWIAIIIGAIATLFILKARSAGKTKVIMLKPNHTYSAGEVSTDGDELKVSKNFKPKFSPLDFFEEKKPTYKFWRNPNRILFILENTQRALSFFDYDAGGKLKAPSLSEKFGWTPKEAKEYIDKLAKKAAVESRPMSQSMFYILLAASIGSLLISLLIAMRIGAI